MIGQTEATGRKAGDVDESFTAVAPAPARAFTLRPYQEELVMGAMSAVAEGKRPGIVLPTGGGKTAVMAGLVQRLREMRKAPVLILQDRGALAQQNGPKIGKWLGITHSQVGGGKDDWDGDVVMAMRQSAAKPERLARISARKWAGVLIDEAHRLGSDEYERIVETLPKKAPVVGLSATLARSDGRALSPLDSVIFGPSIERLIQERFLTPYRFLVPAEALQGLISRGVAQLKTVGGEYSAGDAARLLNTDEINLAVVRQTKERFLDAEDRDGQNLVGFCTTIQHAQDLADAYAAEGVDARVYHSRMRPSDRDETLAAYDRGEFPVLLNPLALGEGFDCARVGAVVILRPCAHRSTFVQIVGRGLRVASKEDYPDVDKRDCIIFDYAAAVTRHRSLDCPPAIDGGEKSEPGFWESKLKDCPDCGASLPQSTRACPECSYEFTGREPEFDADYGQDLVRVAVGGGGSLDWHRVGQRLYVCEEEGAGAIVGDLLDGTYLIFGYQGRRGAQALHPLARVVGAEAAMRRSEGWLADLAEQESKRAGPGGAERLWLRARGFKASDRAVADAVIVAEQAAKAIRSRYGKLEAFETDLGDVEPHLTRSLAAA